MIIGGRKNSVLLILMPFESIELFRFRIDLKPGIRYCAPGQCGFEVSDGNIGVENKFRNLSVELSHRILQPPGVHQITHGTDGDGLFVLKLFWKQRSINLPTLLCEIRFEPRTLFRPYDRLGLLVGPVHTAQDLLETKILGENSIRIITRRVAPESQDNDQFQDRAVKKTRDHETKDFFGIV